MSQSYTALHKREAGYPSASTNPLADAFKTAWRMLRSTAKRIWNALPRPENFHARMILLAEAYTAAHGYLIWPSSALMGDGEQEKSGFRYLDL
ncbi:MAG: hypothetical protein QM758_04915 [Armatimonas sp.]